ncbi:hypothetical protein ACFORH_00455 [Amycolatopsis roodepoortensis]|uniref:Uncharacterized protein n=1 Tax=Amycolatopsis roodepoortensis TaxID=700274 RepID=A0ABR9L539_9PSEU|nr:hypothetical protein [Amycolatopsis roodepoortensis]MBE1575462.1 hypothetical protein [Amycolatopsis roodepoortensis]
MGTNSKTKHAAYTVGPSASEGLPLEDGPKWTDVEIALSVVEGFALNGVDPENPFEPTTLDLPDDIEERYAMFVEAVHEAQAEIAKLSGDPTEFEDALHTQCELFLNGMTQDELKELAVGHGFKHPALVGLSETTGNPLVHWLDPSYPDDAIMKQTIQSVAINRFVALYSGETVGGKTLEQWQQLDASLVATPSHSLPPGFTSWTPTAAEVQAAQEAINSAAGAVETAKVDGSWADPDLVATLIAAENKLATAHNPALDDLETIRSAAKHKVDQAFTDIGPHELSAAIQAAKDHDQIAPFQAKVLNAHQILKLLRASTEKQERLDLKHLAVERAATKVTFEANIAELQKALGPGGLPSLAEPGGIAAMTKFLDHSHQAGVAYMDMGGWKPVEPTLSHNVTLQVAHTEIAPWADQQELKDLRAFVVSTGLLTTDQAAVATKSLCKSMLVHQAYGSTAAVASLKHSLQEKVALKNSTKSLPPKAAKAPILAVPRSAFGRQHAEMLSALKQTKAALAALPKSVDPSVVAAWDFGAGKPAHLGGTHPKTLHTGPDGKTWLAKGEATPRGGAVIAAEAATSRALHRAGLPVVPVFATKINGKPASVQPMLVGATEMSGNPSTWSQTDVDDIVRLHVASWALGNHDPHTGNVLRTGEGGLVPIDHGQSFKFYGQDKLSMSFRPNNTTAVYHQAYDALKAGKLAKGVRVNPAAAHSMIKHLESVPDAEWRGLLRSAAYAGAAQKQMKWAPAMRARAAKQHGIAETSVTTKQVAEAFLDYAVERKKNLRKDFAEFFLGELKLENAAALHHAGKT